MIHRNCNKQDNVDGVGDDDYNVDVLLVDCGGEVDYVNDDDGDEHLHT